MTTSTVNAAALEAARRGAALLDTVSSDWRSKIDVETLDLGDTSECILGQLFKHDADGVTSPWAAGMFFFFESTSDPEGSACGFDLLNVDFYNDDLNQAWLVVLSENHLVSA